MAYISRFTLRKHSHTGKLTGYYRSVESYRNTGNRVYHRTVLNVGLMEDVTVEQLNKIQKQFTVRYERKQVLFEQEQDDPVVNEVRVRTLAMYRFLSRTRP